MENKKKWEIIYETVKTMNYGDIVTHEELSKLIGEPYNSNKYRSSIQRVRKELLKCGKEIESIRDTGYRVLEPDAYIDQSVSKFKQGFNKIKKGNDLLQFAPTKEMSEEGRSTYRKVSDRVQSMYAMMAGGCTELKMLTKKNPAFLPNNVGRK